MGRPFERVSLSPSFPKCPRGRSGGVRGAPRRAPTRAHPAPGFPFLPSLHSPRLAVNRLQKPLSEARVWFGCGRGFAAVRKVKSALCPEETLERQGRCALRLLRRCAGSCHPSARGESGNGPALPSRYQLAWRLERKVTLQAVALGSPHTGEPSAVQWTDPKDAAAESARQGPGIFPRLTPACGL